MVCYFSRDKPLVKPTTPGSLFNIFSFAIYFYLLLFLDLLKQKYKNTLLQFICSAIYLSYPQIYLTSFAYLEVPYPFNTSGCEVLFFVCKGCLRCVAWFSYWFDIWGKYLPPLCCIIPSHYKKRQIHDILGRTIFFCHTYDTFMTIIVTKPGIIIDVVGSYCDKKSW